MGQVESTPKLQIGDTIHKFSHFEEKDIILWSNSFYFLFPSGAVTQVELEAKLESYFPFSDCTLFAQNLFRTINISNSMKIDLHEFLIAYSILIKGSSYEKARWIFKFYDVDCDGVISMNEMKWVMKGLIDLHDSFASKGRGRIDYVEELFARVKNKSGFLTFEEFKEYMESEFTDLCLDSR